MTTGHVFAESVLDGLHESELQDPPAIDVELDHPAVPPGKLGTPDHGVQRQALPPPRQSIDQARIEPEGRGHAIPVVSVLQRRKEMLELPAGGESEGDPRMRQGLFQQCLPAQGGLGRRALEKAPAGRKVEEQVGHVHHGPRRSLVFLQQELPAPRHHEAEGRRGFPPAGRQARPADDRQAGAGGHGGQGLAPKAEGVHAVQILFIPDLGGGVALPAQGQILPGHALSVVGDPDAGLPSSLDAALDAAGPGVDGVVEEFP